MQAGQQTGLDWPLPPPAMGGASFVLPPPPQGHAPHGNHAHMMAQQQRDWAATRGGTLGRHPHQNGPGGVAMKQGGVAMKQGGVAVSPYPLYHTCERQKKRVTIVEDNNTESSVWNFARRICLFSDTLDKTE